MRLDTFIIDSDSIRAKGLKLMLREFFNIEATRINDLDPSELNDSLSAIYITTSDVYTSNPDFFIPRRERTIILSSLSSDAYNVINVNTDESEIIEKFGKIINSAKNSDEGKNASHLSSREIEVLRYIAMGFLNKEIADKLNISINTVLSHRKKITSKLGIKSASGLGFYAIMNGIASEADIRQ